jgi:hypothetical protein
LCRAKEFNVEAMFDRVFKVFFNRIVASNVEHFINKEKEAEPLVVFVILDKVGWFRWGLEKTLGIKPFRRFNIPVFARVDKAIDAFVKEKWYTKVFGIFWEKVCIFQRKNHKVVANDFGLEVGVSASFSMCFS